MRETWFSNDVMRLSHQTPQQFAKVDGHTSIAEPNSSVHVVVVDDEISIAATLAEILATCGYMVTWFSNPLKAQAFALHHSVNILISDVTMPELCGIDLAIALKTMTPQCSVILMSALPEEEVRLQCLQHGHRFELHSKPFRPAAMLDSVARLARRSACHISKLDRVSANVS